MIVKRCKKDVEWLQMVVWFRPAEANVTVCRQTGLRGADNREMASTCYIAGRRVSFTPQLHDTHLLHECVSVCWLVSPAFSLVRCTWRQRGMDVLSSPCLSVSHLRSRRLVTHKPILPSSPLSFDLSFPRYLFCCSLLFSLHLSSSQLAYALSSLPLSLAGCLSASACLALISLLGEDSLAPSISLFLPPSRPCNAITLSPSQTLKYQ